MSQVATSKSARSIDEDLAVQDTLSMGTEQRLELLVSLIVDKIIEDERLGRQPFDLAEEASS